MRKPSVPFLAFASYLEAKFTPSFLGDRPPWTVVRVRFFDMSFPSLATPPSLETFPPPLPLALAARTVGSLSIARDSQNFASSRERLFLTTKFFSSLSTRLLFHPVLFPGLIDAFPCKYATRFLPPLSATAPGFLGWTEALRSSPHFLSFLFFSSPFNFEDPFL